VICTLFVEEFNKLEYRQYRTATGVISKFKEETLKAVEKFETYVLGQHYTAKQADVILSTTHSAKGMEWDHVELCADFHKLANLNKEGVGSGDKRESVGSLPLPNIRMN
jgi:superfamily I DNA/RNA helicase